MSRKESWTDNHIVENVFYMGKTSTIHLRAVMRWYRWCWGYWAGVWTVSPSLLLREAVGRGLSEVYSLSSALGIHFGNFWEQSRKNQLYSWASVWCKSRALSVEEVHSMWLNHWQGLRWQATHRHPENGRLTELLACGRKNWDTKWLSCVATL